MTKSYAVISLQGKQHKVCVGDELVIDLLDKKPTEKFSANEILLTNLDEKIRVGKPLVESAQVELEVIEHLQGPKIRVAKFQAKSRYHKVRGHRQQQTKLKIIAIS